MAVKASHCYRSITFSCVYSGTQLLLIQPHQMSCIQMYEYTDSEMSSAYNQVHKNLVKGNICQIPTFQM